MTVFFVDGIVKLEEKGRGDTTGRLLYDLTCMIIQYWYLEIIIKSDVICTGSIVVQYLVVTEFWSVWGTFVYSALYCEGLWVVQEQMVHYFG